MLENEIWDKARDRIFELYGDRPDCRIISRFYSEKMFFAHRKVGKYFYDLAMLRAEAEKSGERLVVKNPVMSCLIAYLLGTTEENPLPAHYYCPKCKTVEWMDGKCVFDLHVKDCACGAKMIPDGFDIPFETYLPYVQKLNAVDFVSENDQQLADSGHTHFQKSLLDTVGICKRLEHATGVLTDDIDWNDQKVKRCLLKGEFDCLTGAAGGKMIKNMITYTNPKSYLALAKLIGLSHGTYTWRNNAERLLADGICLLEDIPATRDEVFMALCDALRDCNICDNGFAYDVSNKACRGYYLENGIDDYTNQMLAKLGFDAWFANYIGTTYYMSTKALTVLELKYLIILNWYRVYAPEEYHVAMRDWLGESP